MNAERLARSLKLLRTVNRFRVTRARWPRHVAQELAWHEEQLRAHDEAAAELKAIDRRHDTRQIVMPWY